MLVKWKSYKLLDGSEKTLVQQVGDGNIIRRFEKTPYPENPSDVVCPHFLELAWSWGCPYDCSWCLSGDTLVLTADLQWVPMRDVKLGDMVLGVEFLGRSRRLVATPVLAKDMTQRMAVKLSVESTSVICSLKHRWLGIKRRFRYACSLSEGSQVAYLGSAEPPVLGDPNYQRGYFAGVSHGDGSWDESGLQPFYQLVMRDMEALERASEFGENQSGVAFNWGTHVAERWGNSEIPMIQKRGRFNLVKLCQLLKLEMGEMWIRGFLAGFFDADGTNPEGRALRFSQKVRMPPEIVGQYLNKIGFNSFVEGGACRLLGGVSEKLRFLANTMPAINRKKNLGKLKFEHVEVDEWEIVGKSLLYDIQTGTGNFIAEGLVSHNCYLKGTYRFFKDERTGRILPHFKDRDQIKKVCEPFVYEVQEPEILNAGELSDSLMGENLKPVPWSVFIQSIFEGSPHKILHLTKGDNVRNFLEHDWQKNAILSWSVNEPEVSRTWEKLAPDPFKRLNAAKKVSDAGYEVRLRIDPIVPVMDFKQKYRRFIDEIFKRDLQPERITLGTLRGLPSTLAHVKNHSWESFLNKKTGMSSWGYKPRLEARLEMYQDLTEHLKQYGVKVGICKDTLKLWKTLGLQFERIACNCVA